MRISQRLNIALHLKILAILYPSLVVIRLILAMAGYVEPNDTLTIIRSPIAYIYKFVFFVFLFLRLLSIFQNTPYGIEKWK